MIDHAGEILILTGPPGAGKTTAGESLAHLPGSLKVHLHSDFFWGFIKHGLIPPWLPGAREQNKVVVNAFAQAAKAYINGGYFVVLDGIVRPEALPIFTALQVPLHYIVLRPPLNVAIQRCQQRGGDTLTDAAAITGVYQDFASLGELERHVLPTDGLSRQEILEQVVKVLESGAFRIS